MKVALAGFSSQAISRPSVDAPVLQSRPLLFDREHQEQP